jgi:hypothetical protein
MGFHFVVMFIDSFMDDMSKRKGGYFPTICFYKFKVCKSVYHHTIQINHHLDATISPVYYLTFIYSSTRFGLLTPIIRSSTTAVLLVVVGLAGPTTTNSTAITTLQR